MDLFIESISQSNVDEYDLRLTRSRWNQDDVRVREIFFSGQGMKPCFGGSPHSNRDRSWANHGTG